MLLVSHLGRRGRPRFPDSPSLWAKELRQSSRKAEKNTQFSTVEAQRKAEKGKLLQTHAIVDRQAHRGPAFARVVMHAVSLQL